MQANADQKEEEEGKWAATKGMQYSARGRKLTYSRKAIVMFILPIVAWMGLIILNYGLSYMFIYNTQPRLDSVNGGSRVQVYSKLYLQSCNGNQHSSSSSLSDLAMLICLLTYTCSP